MKIFTFLLFFFCMALLIPHKRSCAQNKYVHHINGVNLVSVLILIKRLWHWQTISWSLWDKKNDILLCNWKWHLISMMYTFSEMCYLSLFLILCIFATCRETSIESADACFSSAYFILSVSCFILKQSCCFMGKEI